MELPGQKNKLADFKKNINLNLNEVDYRCPEKEKLLRMK